MVFEYLLHLKHFAYFNGTKSAATIYFFEKNINITSSFIVWVTK